MSMIRPIAWLAAAVVALAMAGSAFAQGMPTSPGGDHLWEFQPFIDPGYKPAVAFSVMVIMLIWRPTGLFRGRA